MEINYSPSLMCVDLLNLRSEVENLANAGCTTYHIDVMDGNYVPNMTLGLLDIKAIDSISTLPLEVHLMVSEPAKLIDLFDLKNVSTIFVHPESCTDLRQTLLKIKSLKKRPGIAINPNSSLSTLVETIDLVEAIIVMAVNPGYAGQKFIETTYEKLQSVTEICTKYSCKAEILLDGSVSDKNIKQLVEYGATGFVLGTAGLFRDGNDYVANLNHLKEALR